MCVFICVCVCVCVCTRMHALVGEGVARKWTKLCLKLKLFQLCIMAFWKHAKYSSVFKKTLDFLLLLLLSRFSCVRLCATPETQPTRLPHPWDSPGKNTGVGCHFLLRWMKVKVKSLSRVRPSATPWTAAYQAPPSMGFAGKSTGVGAITGFPSPLPLLDFLVHHWKNKWENLSNIRN